MADPEVKPIKVNADPYRSDLDRNHRICRYYSSDFGHRHLGPGFFFSILSIKCASTTYMNPLDMLRCEINAFMNYAPDIRKMGHSS
jgi:hypothetical protein